MLRSCGCESHPFVLQAVLFIKQITIFYSNAFVPLDKIFPYFGYLFWKQILLFKLNNTYGLNISSLINIFCEFHQYKKSH